MHYGDKPALNGVSFDVYQNEILGIIGPAQSGKTTLLKVINRTLEFTSDTTVEGSVKLEGVDISTIGDVYGLRRRIGMVLPLPVGLPLSIYDNVAFAPRTAGIRGKSELDEIVERCLQQAALWDEVKDRLNTLGTQLSGGQQQRLTIARALSHQPEILCLDEFSIAVDPVTTMRIEEVLKTLQTEMTILLVTNLVQQAKRLANRTAFFLNGDLIEIDATDVIFSENPSETSDLRLREREFWLNWLSAVSSRQSAHIGWIIQPLRNPKAIIVKPTINYTSTEGGVTNPASGGRGSFSLAN